MAGPRIETVYITKRIAPAKLGLLCLATILLSCNVPEAELAVAVPSADEAALVSKFRCDAGGRCSWQLVPHSSAQQIIVKSDMVDLLSSVLSSFLIYLAKGSNIPYYYLPWLVLSLKGFLMNEGPAILSLGRNIILSRSISASCFYLTCIFIVVQQISVWSDVFQIFCRVWQYYIHHLPREIF